MYVKNDIFVFWSNVSFVLLRRQKAHTFPSFLFAMISRAREISSNLLANRKRERKREKERERDAETHW